MRRSRRFASITDGATPRGSTRHPAIYPRPCTPVHANPPFLATKPRSGTNRPHSDGASALPRSPTWAFATAEHAFATKMGGRRARTRFGGQKRAISAHAPPSSAIRPHRRTSEAPSAHATQHARRRASLRPHDTQPPYPTARTFLPATSALPSHLVPLALAFESGLRNIIIGADGQTSASPCLPNARPSSLFRSPRIRDAA